jgi:hypothetical protein
VRLQHRVCRGRMRTGSQTQIPPSLSFASILCPLPLRPSHPFIHNHTIFFSDAHCSCLQCAEPCSPGYYRPSCTGSCVRCTTDPCTVAGTYRPNECAAGLTYRDPPCTLCPTLPNRTSWVEGGQNCEFTCETGWQRNGSTNWAVDACITCYECVQENSIYHVSRFWVLGFGFSRV